MVEDEVPINQVNSKIVKLNLSTVALFSKFYISVVKSTDWYWSSL